MKSELPPGWPKDKLMAVSINIPFEWWVEGDSSGVSPMGNPLKPGYKDTAALQWAEYALKHGIYRMLDVAERHNMKVTSSVSVIITESHPEALKRLDAGGHEIQAHAWAQGDLAAYMSREEEDANIKRCMAAFEKCLGYVPKSYGIPRGTISELTLISRKGRDQTSSNAASRIAARVRSDLPILSTGSGSTRN